MANELLSLRWDNHQSSFTQTLSSDRSSGYYCDVTLTCDSNFYNVHKLVLASCSDYFAKMFHYTEEKHPLIVLAVVDHEVLENLLDYMYEGQVDVLSSVLPDLLKTAGKLKIKGLTESLGEHSNSREKRHLENDVNAADSKMNLKKDRFNSKRTFDHDNDIAESKRQKVDHDMFHTQNVHIKQEDLSSSSMKNQDNLSIATQDVRQKHTLIMNNTETPILQEPKPLKFLRKWLKLLSCKKIINPFRTMSLCQYNDII